MGERGRSRAVTRPVDHAHAAGPESTQDLVRTNPCSGSQRHGRKVSQLPQKGPIALRGASEVPDCHLEARFHYPDRTPQKAPLICLAPGMSADPGGRSVPPKPDHAPQLAPANPPFVATSLLVRMGSHHARGQNRGADEAHRMKRHSSTDSWDAVADDRALHADTNGHRNLFFLMFFLMPRLPAKA